MDDGDVFLIKDTPLARGAAAVFVMNSVDVIVKIPPASLNVAKNALPQNTPLPAMRSTPLCLLLCLFLFADH